MKRYTLVFTLGIALLGASPPHAISPQMAAHIDAAVRSALALQHVPAASLAIAERGHVVYAKGYGLRNVDDGLQADANTTYRLGSITKQFTAASIMLLQEEGKLNVNDLLAKYLPDAPHAKEVTLRNLLSHTSGIANFTEVPSFAVAVSTPTTPEQIVATIRNEPLAFKPGTTWQYSNTNYTLLGMVVSKVSGTPYKLFVERHFLRPFGLTTAVFWNNRAIVHDVAIGYTSYAMGPLYHADYWNASWTGAAGGLSMSAIDLAKWDIALDSGKAVSPASFAAMSTSQLLANHKSAGYGYGLGVQKFLNRNVVVHTGEVAGFLTDNWTVPSDGLAIVLLSNGDNFDPAPIVRDIAATLYGVPVPKRKVTVLREQQSVHEKALRLLTQTFFERSSPLEKRFGPPLNIQLVAIHSDYSGSIGYTYRTTFANDVLEYDVWFTDSGKVDELYLIPWYNY